MVVFQGLGERGERREEGIGENEEEGGRGWQKEEEEGGEEWRKRMMGWDGWVEWKGGRMPCGSPSERETSVLTS